MVLFDVVCSITVTWYAAASPDKTLLPLLIQERERDKAGGVIERTRKPYFMSCGMLSYYSY